MGRTTQMVIAKIRESPFSFFNMMNNKTITTTTRIGHQRRRQKLSRLFHRFSRWIIALSWCVSLLFVHQNSILVTVDATIPPTPDLLQEGYENVFQERRRLGVKYEYETKWLSPELCRNISTDICKTWDEKFGKTIETNRHFLTPHRRKRLLSHHHHHHNKIDAERAEEHHVTLGGIKVLVMLLQWEDHDERRLIHPQQIELLFNSEDIDQELIPTGSIERYFNVNSFGQFKIAADIVPWMETDNSEAYYSSLGDSGRSPEIENAFIPLLNKLDESVKTDGFDFAPYDADNDKVIDMVIFLHSGYAAELGGQDCDSFASSSMRIGSHASTSIGSVGWRSVQGYTLGGYVVASAFRGTCGSNIARIGTIIHEMSHLFGLPDLYDLEGPLHPTGNVGGLGNYDIMSNPNGQMNSQSRPGHFSAWSKFQLGWIEPIEIVEPGQYTLRPVELFPDVYRISMNYQPGEYLLLENRQPIPGDFDERFWGPGGVVIYHVNENNMGLGNSIRGGPFQDDWPLNGNHYGVTVLQRDGLYELEQSINGGHNQDFYYEADHILGPGNGEVVTEIGVYPNTDSYAFGVVQPTGIDLRGFELTDGGLVTFQVAFKAQTRQIIIESESPSTSPSTSPAPSEAATPEPSLSRTQSPTQAPVTAEPTMTPEEMTESPTQTPTVSPRTESPTVAPTTNAPTTAPTAMPEEMTAAPTESPAMTPAPSPDTPSPVMTRAPSPDTPSPVKTPAPSPDTTPSPVMTPAPIPDSTPAPVQTPPPSTEAPTKTPSLAPQTSSPIEIPTMPAPSPTRQPTDTSPVFIPPISRPTVPRPSVHQEPTILKPTIPGKGGGKGSPKKGKGQKMSKKLKKMRKKGKSEKAHGKGSKSEYYGRGKGKGHYYSTWHTTWHTTRNSPGVKKSFGIANGGGNTARKWRRQPNLSTTVRAKWRLLDTRSTIKTDGKKRKKMTSQSLGKRARGDANPKVRGI